MYEHVKIEFPKATDPGAALNIKSNSILCFDEDSDIYATDIMPPHIKKNFIYRKVWREVWANDSNANFIVIGKPGSGKSVNVLKMAFDLDPTFNLERVCYNINDFLRLLHKGDSNGELHPGNVIVFDEIVTDKGADSRSFMSKTNKLMNYINATFRARRLVVFYCLPSLTQLDKNIREINVTGIFEVLTKDVKQRKNLVKFQWNSYDAKTQKVYYMFPRLVDDKGMIFKVDGLWIGLPSKEIIKAYKKKKMEYLAKNISRWSDMAEKELKKENKDTISDMEIMNQIQAEKDKYIISGKFNNYRIKTAFGISQVRAAVLAGYLNKSKVLG